MGGDLAIAGSKKRLMNKQESVWHKTDLSPSKNVTHQ